MRGRCWVGGVGGHNELELFQFRRSLHIYVNSPPSAGSLFASQEREWSSMSHLSMIRRHDHHLEDAFHYWWKEYVSGIQVIDVDRCWTRNEVGQDQEGT
jgi:hypothetical protein